MTIQEVNVLLNEGDALLHEVKTLNKSARAKTKREAGELVRRIRQGVGRKPTEFSSKLGITRQTLDNWESGAVVPKLWLIRSKLSELISSFGVPDLIERLGILFADDIIELLKKRSAQDVWIVKASSFFEGLPENEKLREFVWAKLADGCNFNYVFPNQSEAATSFEIFKTLTNQRIKRCKKPDFRGDLKGYRIVNDGVAADLRLPRSRGEVPCAWIAVQYRDEEYAHGGRSMLQSDWDIFIAESVAEYIDKAKSRQKEDGQICWFQLPSSHVALWQSRIRQAASAPSKQVEIITITDRKKR